MEKLDKEDSIRYQLKKEDILYFQHIPKTAGTSLIFTLENYFDFDEILPSQRWDQLITNMPKDFSKYRFVSGHFGYDIYKILPTKPVYITMLRKPTDLITSHYNHLQRFPHFRKRYNISENESISDLLLRPTIHNQENPQCKWLVADVNLLSKKKEWEISELHEWMIEDLPEFNISNISDDELFEKAKNRLLEFAFFGLVERYEESLFLLHYTFGWKPIRDTTKLNIAPKRNEKISEGARKILRKRTRADEQLYEFAQNLFEARYSNMMKDLKKYYESKYDNMDENDVVYDMLEKHYNFHYNEKHSRISSIDYHFDKVLFGTGWHEREIQTDSKIKFRWTGPNTKSEIDFPLSKEKDLKIQFHVLSSMSPDILNSLQLKVNDTPIPIKKSERIFHKSREYFEGIITTSVLKNNTNYTRLTFEVNKTISPKSIDPKLTDDRKLGLAFDWIKIIPLKKRLF